MSEPDNTSASVPDAVSIIKDNPVIKINVNDIKMDNTNPNEMTDEQMNALKFSMTKFGYLYPIIVDQNNLLADGEHRLKVFLEHGKTEIPSIRLNMTDTERRVLRQQMNKLHGRSDPLKDAEDIYRIIQNGNKDILKILTVTNDVQIENALRILDGNTLHNIVDAQDSIKPFGSETGESNKGDPQIINGQLSTEHLCPRCGYKW